MKIIVLTHPEQEGDDSTRDVVVDQIVGALKSSHPAYSARQSRPGVILPGTGVLDDGGFRKARE